MRNGWTSLASAMVLAAIAGTSGCSSDGSSGAPGDGGSGGATGSSGSSSAGGASSGTSSTGGKSTGGTSTGGTTSGGSGTGGSSGTGEDGGGTSVTTLSGTEKLGALTTAEATQLCNDTFEYFGRSISKAMACKWAALTVSASSSSPTDQQLETFCTTQQSNCLQADAGTGSGGHAGCLGTVASSCTATVAQYSSCISDETSALIDAVNGLPDCTTLKNTDTTAIFNAQGASSPASCMAISSACSGVFPPDPSQM